MSQGQTFDVDAHQILADDRPGIIVLVAINLRGLA